MDAHECTSQPGAWVALLALGLAGWTAALPVGAAPAYVATPLTLGGTSSKANGINASGQVTGCSDRAGDLAQRAFLYSAGAMIDLGTLGGTRSCGTAININGEVAGNSDLAGDVAEHAFLYSGGTLRDLGTLGGNSSRAVAINASGQVAGTADLAVKFSYHAFLYSDGVMRDLGTLGKLNSTATAINASGEVVGSTEGYVLGITTLIFPGSAFLYSGSQMYDLGSSHSADSSIAKDINDAGQVTGYRGFALNVSHAFLWLDETVLDLGALMSGRLGSSRGRRLNARGQVVGQANVPGSDHAILYADGVMIDLGTLPGRAWSDAVGINASGHVVGRSYYGSSNPPPDHAFVYRDGTMHDLNDLVVAGLGGAILTKADAINDNGQIIAHDCTGPCKAFLLDPLRNFGGLWWNAPAGSESGWGINFAHQGDVIFATWFTYDATGKALWLSMTANKTGEGVYSGTLNQTRGPAFSAVPFSPAAVTATAVGTGMLTFGDLNNGSFAYVVNGTAQTKAITRQVFGPMPACIFGAQPDLALAANYQDLWYAAPAESEAGWGVNFTHQGDIIFATWFTYDTDGTPLWLSATAPKTGNGTYTGTLYRTTGPAFNAVPFLPDNVALTPAGTLTLAFANGNSGTFAYTVDGVTQSKAITRQVFRAPGTVCR